MQEHNELAHTNNNQIDTTSLQPMSFTDILDGMFSLYRSHFQLFWGIIAVYIVLGLAIDQISAFLITSGAVSGTSVAVLVFTILCSIVLSIFVSAGLTYASGQAYLGSAITSQEAFQQASVYFWMYLATTFLWGLPVVGLSMTVIGIPLAIYFGVRWGLYSLPVIFEGSRTWNALARSAELVKGSWLRVFAITLVIYLITFMITFILEYVFGFVLSSVGVAELEEPTTPLETVRRLFIPASNEIGWFAYTVRGFVRLCISAFTMPLERIGFTLLYFDQRIRKESFGIEMPIND